MNSTNVKHYFPLIVFLSMLISRLPLSGEFATSVVPGWHTTIFPPYFILGLIVTVCLLFATIGYLKLARTKEEMNWLVFIAHLLLTLPMFIFSNPNIILMSIDAIGIDEQISQFLIVEYIILALYILFFIGQLLFTGYFLKRIYFKSKSQV